MCKIYHKGESLEGGFYEKERLSSCFGYADNGNDGNCVCSDKLFYWIPVYYNNEGYNSTPVKKVILPADHAYVKALGSNHNELPTNYIVIANNSAQMTQGSINFMNSDRSKHSIPYKAAYL